MGLTEPNGSFAVPSRIHVMPLGYEKERVYESADRLKADKVILLVHQDDVLEDFTEYQAVTAELEDRGIEYETERCDLFGLFDSLSVFADYVGRYSDDEVFVNVSTGSKVTAIAGMIACMVFDATPYYVKNQDHEDNDKTGAGKITALPDYDIEAPEKQEIEMMEFIAERVDAGDPATKGDLIHEAEKRQFPFITQNEVQEKGKYRLLDREIIEPLKESGRITLEKAGREKQVYLTDQGREALKAFSSLV